MQCGSATLSPSSCVLVHGRPGNAWEYYTIGDGSLFWTLLRSLSRTQSTETDVNRPLHSTCTPLLSDSISLGGPWLHAFNTHLVLCDPSMSFVQNILNCINLSIILSPILCLVKGQRSWMITQKHFNWEFILYKRNGTQEKTFKRLHKSTVTEGHACMLKRLFQCWLFYSSVKRTEFYAPWCVVSSCISR